MRTVVDVGPMEYKGAPHRLLVIETDTTAEMDQALALALERGWFVYVEGTSDKNRLSKWFLKAT